MRAKRVLRARSAVRSGALTLTLAAAVVVLGSISAVALGATSPSGIGGLSTARTDATSASRIGAKSASRTRAEARRKHRRARHMRVAAAPSRLLVPRASLAAPLGSTVVVHGLLRPGHPGATVKLVELAGRRWRTIGVARTRGSGRFGIPYRVHGYGATWIRVAFDGSRRARAVSAAAGRIVALAPTIASWYYDAGNTACGFHATFGVANKTLPCGTRVTLSYGGRTVVATVDDRGPYVYGRTFDLNQNTARYLGMWGVGQVYASV